MSGLGLALRVHKSKYSQSPCSNIAKRLGTGDAEFP